MCAHDPLALLKEEAVIWLIECPRRSHRGRPGVHAWAITEVVMQEFRDAPDLGVRNGSEGDRVDRGHGDKVRQLLTRRHRVLSSRRDEGSTRSRVWRGGSPGTHLDRALTRLRIE